MDYVEIWIMSDHELWVNMKYGRIWFMGEYEMMNMNYRDDGGHTHMHTQRQTDRQTDTSIPWLGLAWPREKLQINLVLKRQKKTLSNCAKIMKKYLSWKFHVQQ